MMDGKPNRKECPKSLKIGRNNLKEESNMQVENLEKVKKLYDERAQIQKALDAITSKPAERLEIMVATRNVICCGPCSSTIQATMSIENQVPYLKKALEQRLEDIYKELKTL